MEKLIQNAFILIAGFFLVAGAAIATAVLVVYAFGVVTVRRLKPGRPTLTAASETSSGQQVRP